MERLGMPLVWVLFSIERLVEYFHDLRIGRNVEGRFSLI